MVLNGRLIPHASYSSTSQRSWELALFQQARRKSSPAAAAAAADDNEGPTTGALSAKEFIRLARRCRVTATAVDDDAIAKILQRFDEDDDGCLSWAEFRKFLSYDVREAALLA